MVFGYIRELENGQESTPQVLRAALVVNSSQSTLICISMLCLSSLFKVSLSKFKTMIKDTAKLTLEGVSVLDRDITMSMDFLKVFVLHIHGKTVGELVVIPSIVQRPFKVEFLAPAANFTIEVSIIN